MKRAALLLLAATALALAAAFLGQWLNHSRNGSTNPPDDPAHPTGPYVEDPHRGLHLVLGRNGEDEIARVGGRLGRLLFALVGMEQVRHE